MSIPLFRYSTTLSKLPALAARRKLALLSDCKKRKKKNSPVSACLNLSGMSSMSSAVKGFHIYAAGEENCETTEFELYLH